MRLPIQDVLPDISSLLQEKIRLVLAAPPGAGKTTGVPLHLLNEPWVAGRKIIVLEPRRIAAKRAAERMAEVLGEKLGETVGVRSRVETRVSAKTRIEVVTEGVFTNQVIKDPDLPNIAAVLFDEFHERSLEADLGLSLARESQSVFRDDLRLVVMSATLDTEAIARKLDCPVLVSEGRAFPVETIYIGKSPSDPVHVQMAGAVRRALREQEGSILAFLPGAADIRRTAEQFADLPDDVVVAPLYGALSPQDQDRAISSAPKGCRKVVLSTDLAESSLTIEGVRIVIDAGLARVPEPARGQAAPQLRTIRASLANVDQRRGRAGRTEPGVCYRLWDEEETRGLVKAPEPEIMRSDLSGLLLRLMAWGANDPSELLWIDAPPTGALAAARNVLLALGLLSDDGNLSKTGKHVSALPLSPRLGCLIAGADTESERVAGAWLAALLSEVGLGGKSIDLGTRMAAFRTERSQRARALQKRAEGWAGSSKAPQNLSNLLVKLWPDRLARKQAGTDDRFQLAGGGAVRLPKDINLDKKWIVVADMVGSGKGDARLTLAGSLQEKDVVQFFPEEKLAVATYDPKTNTARAMEVSRVGELVLNERPLAKPSKDALVRAVQDVCSAQGLDVLPGWPGLKVLLARFEFVSRYSNEILPTVDSLTEGLDDWLLPAVHDKGLSILEGSHLAECALGSLDWAQRQLLDKFAPVHWSLREGRRLKIAYGGERDPSISARVQDFYGIKSHPTVGDSSIPLTIELLSPAQRPVATTRDLPSFWKGGYGDMRKDMRGRYPKHDWPEDPANATPPKPRPRNA